jgi:hypothetical protein
LGFFGAYCFGFGLDVGGGIPPPPTLPIGMMYAARNDG